MSEQTYTLEEFFRSGIGNLLPPEQKIIFVLAMHGRDNPMSTEQIARCMNMGVSTGYLGCVKLRNRGHVDCVRKFINEDDLRRTAFYRLTKAGERYYEEELIGPIFAVFQAMQ